MPQFLENKFSYKTKKSPHSPPQVPIEEGEAASIL